MVLGFLEKRLNVLEREIGNYQRRLLEVEQELRAIGSVSRILDEESFRRWFTAYRLAQKKDNSEVTLESMWIKYKTTVLDNSWMKWKPLMAGDDRSPQTEFLLSDDLEVLYGGAAGGGKTAALLMGALQYADTPDYSALLLRRTYPDLALPKTLMDLAHRWLKGTRARWSGRDHCYVFPSGAKLVFGYCEHPGDEERYRSSEFQYVGVDEVTEWRENQYTFLFSRLRRPKNLDVPLRMRCATNPGGVGHEWVKQRFLVEAAVSGRRFIPARLFDNPQIDQASYVRSLMNLDPLRRAQILDGNWDINPEGCKFQRGWFRIVDDYPRGYHVVRYWDKASTEPERGKDPDWTAGVKATMVEGVFYVLDMVRFRGTPQLNESTIRQIAEIDGREVDVFMEQEPGSAGVNDIDNYAREVLLGFSFRGVRTTGSKELRANPVSSSAEQGNVKLVRGAWNRDLLDEFELFPDGAHDDIVDATSGAFGKLTETIPLGGDAAPSMFGN